MSVLETVPLGMPWTAADPFLFCVHHDDAYPRGNAQWLTAGSGISHSEMFPLVESEKENPLELFQIWLNLPASEKFADPHFTMFWANDIPRVSGGGTDV